MRHYINNEGNGKYYEFKTFKVYWAYRHFTAKEIDKRSATVPITKKIAGRIVQIIEQTNYAEKYL